MEPASFFSALANTIRLRAVVLLGSEGELCVCELTHALGLSQPAVSRHLALLRRAGMVASRREGQWVHYRLEPGLERWQRELLEGTCEALAAEAPFATDLARLREMPDRPGARCHA